MRRVQVRQLATHQWGDRYIVRENSFSPSGPGAGPDVSIAVTSGTTTNNGSTYKAALNNAITLTCTASATVGAVAYQWKKDGVAIPGATLATYNPPVNFLTTPNGNDYLCEVTDDAGSFPSNTLKIIVEVLIFTETKIAGEYVELSDVTLEVTTFGEAPTAFQWFQDGAPISGATTNPYTIYAAQLARTGIYTLVVTTASGQAVTDQYFVLIVSQDDAIPPSVTIGPISPPPRVSQDETLNLFGNPVGTGPRSLQWRRSVTGMGLWVPIAGQTEANLTIVNAQKGTDDRFYRLDLTTPLGTATSNVIKVEIYDVPFITNLTASFTGAIGQDYTLTVTAKGEAPLSYQWQKETSPGVWSNIGTDSTSFPLPDIQPSDSGNYRVQVSNVLGTITSSVINVLVEELILFPSTENPTQVAGVNFTRGVTAVGPGPFTYQWQRETSPGVWEDIVGQTSATINFTSTTPATSGNYRVVVTNPLTTKNLVIAILVVAGIISINDIGLVPVWGGPLPINTAVQTAVSTTYQWYKDDVVIPGATAQNYTIPTSLPADDGAVYKVIATNVYGTFEDSWTFTGGVVVKWLNAPPVKIEAGNNYTLTNPNESYGTRTFSWDKNNVLTGVTTETISFNPLIQSDEGTYQLTITNEYGSSESPSGRFLEVDNIKFTAQPVDITSSPGGSVGFLCTATGPGTLTYQWFKDAVAIPGETSQALIISDVSDDSVAGYYCVVSNEYGSRQSATANLLLVAIVTSVDDFTIPARVDLLNINVPDVLTLNVGQIVYINNDGGVGFFTIQAITGNQLTLLFSTAPSGGESLQVLPVGTFVNGASSIRLDGFAAEVAVQPSGPLTENIDGFVAEVSIAPALDISLDGFAAEVCVSGFAPDMLTAPARSGVQDPGNDLTATDGTWAFNPTSFSRQWYRGNTPIPGATNLVYSVTSADVGHRLKYGVIATNANGSSAEVFSTPTAVIGSLPQPLKFPGIIGWWDTLNPENTIFGTQFSILKDKSENNRPMTLVATVTPDLNGVSGLTAATFNGTSNSALVAYTGNVGTLMIVMKQNSPNLNSGKGVFTGNALNGELVADSTTKWQDRDAVTGVASGLNGVRLGAPYVNKTQTGVIPTGYVVLQLRGTPQLMEGLLLASDRLLGGYANFSFVCAIAYDNDLGTTNSELLVDFLKPTYNVP